MVKLTLPTLEPKRACWLYPIGSLHRSGAVLAFGSDWSVLSPNPLDTIEVAITCMGPKGETKDRFIHEERIDLPEALAAFNIGAAYVNFQDDKTGSIEPGKLAGLVVLDRSLFTIEPEAISDARVVLTLLGGQPVHRDSDVGSDAPTFPCQARSQVGDFTYRGLASCTADGSCDSNVIPDPEDFLDALQVCL